MATSAYTRYAAATTEGTKQSLVPQQVAGLDASFITFVNDYTPINPDDVDISAVPGLSFVQEELFRTLLSTLFHIRWSGDYVPRAHGAGNTLMHEMKQTSSTSYASTEVQFFNPGTVIPLVSPTITVSDSSVVFRAGLTTFTYEISPYTTETGRAVWRFKIVRDGYDARELYYLVPCTL